MFSKIFKAVIPALILSSVAQAAANVDITSVGAKTLLSSKSKICNVLDYGAVGKLLLEASSP